MPYISPGERYVFDDRLKDIRFTTKGQLEYCIFKLMKLYMSDRQSRYSTLHDCTYAAQHCADEFRRRYLDVRETEALTENGDV